MMSVNYARIVGQKTRMLSTRHVLIAAKISLSVREVCAVRGVKKRQILKMGAQELKNSEICNAITKH